MQELFINEKPVKILVAIRQRQGEVYSSILSDDVNTTYSHTVNIVSKLQESGLLEVEKKGRKKVIHLTEEGKEYSDGFISLLDSFQDQPFSAEMSQPDQQPDSPGKRPTLSENTI